MIHGDTGKKGSSTLLINSTSLRNGSTSAPSHAARGRCKTHQTNSLKDEETGHLGGAESIQAVFLRFRKEQTARGTQFTSNLPYLLETRTTLEENSYVKSRSSNGQGGKVESKLEHRMQG